MDIDNLFLATEMLDGVDNVIVAAALRPAVHTEIYSVVVAAEGIHIAFKVVKGRANTCDTSQCSAGGRIVRM